MLAVMTERIRLIIDTDDEVRRAVQLRRLRQAGNPTTSDVVNAILREALAEEIAENRKHLPGSERPKKKRGRPAKGEEGGAS